MQMDLPVEGTGGGEGSGEQGLGGANTFASHGVVGVAGLYAVEGGEGFPRLFEMETADAESEGSFDPFGMKIYFGLEQVGAFLPALEAFHASYSLHEEVGTGGDEFEEAAEGVEGIFILLDGEMVVGERFELTGRDGGGRFAGKVGKEERFRMFAVLLQRHFDDFRGAGSVGHGDSLRDHTFRARR